MKDFAIGVLPLFGVAFQISLSSWLFAWRGEARSLKWGGARDATLYWALKITWVFWEILMIGWTFWTRLWPSWTVELNLLPVDDHLSEPLWQTSLDVDRWRELHLAVGAVNQSFLKFLWVSKNFFCFGIGAFLLVDSKHLLGAPPEGMRKAALDVKNGLLEKRDLWVCISD